MCFVNKRKIIKKKKKKKTMCRDDFISHLATLFLFQVF